MSTYRACAIAGRVVVIHDMADRAVISELEADQADLLLRQLELALRAVVRELAERRVPPGLAALD